MKVRTSVAADGGRWMLAGLATFRRQPLGFTSLMMMVMLLMGLLLVVPGIGALLMLAVLPGLSAGWIACGEAASQGQRVLPHLLLRPLFSPTSRITLWTLGGLFAMVCWGSLLVVDWADPDFRQQWQVAMSPGDDETRASALGAAQQGMLLRGLVILPWAWLFWQAPAIAVRDGAGAAKALFGSIVTMLRHVPAFLVYGAAWLAADVAVSLLLGLLLGLAGATQWLLALAMPVSIVFCAAFYASLHATVSGCLQFDGDAPPAT